jgi:hypothetical protein
MAYDGSVTNDTRMPRIISDAEAAKVDMVLREFAQMQPHRAEFEGHWEEVASLIDPTSVNTFTYQHYNTPGEKKTSRQVDASGMMALGRFKAICDSLLTPRNMMYEAVVADDDYVMKDRATKLWFEDTTRKLFKYRYAPVANFSAQNQNVYGSLGAYGTAPLFIDKLVAPNGARGLRYKALPLGQVFLRENHQGIVDGFIRWFRWNARQIKEAWPDRFPAELEQALNSASEETFVILHRVAPNEKYDPEKISSDSLLYSSCYVCEKAKCVLQEGGYNSIPLVASRYEQAPGEIYGRSPAMMVLPALKTLNAEKRTFLKQGHRAADPVLLVGDDGLVDMSLRPGAMNKGGVNADGRPLVHVLPTGNIQINEKMMEMERSLINDAFLVTLFQILTETPQMTATEVIERTNEKGILLAPTVGRQQSEYRGPAVDRELDLLSEQKLLLPMPPRLLEAAGSYKMVHQSPMARAMRAQEAAGFMRTLEVADRVAQITQDPSVYDPFDFDVAVPEIAEIHGVKPSWMADDKKIKAKREGRARSQAAAQQIQAAPAQAALMSAKAKQVAAGVPQEQPVAA